MSTAAKPREYAGELIWVGVGIIVWALPIRIAIELTKAWFSGSG
jgi:uncharacterized membrane protein YczE